ncbi:hypothetical protein ACQPZA_28645 [Pseudonocardia xinjiangensis]|uniref:hypothetical protein n=1 Tax=Pseudonocardia xinjiangensis TaxID=75289 RepID=UPI003D94961F
MARLLTLQRTAGNAAVRHLVEQRPSTGNDVVPVQRRLRLADRDIGAEGTRAAEETWRRVEALPSYRQRTRDEQDQMRKQFWKWVDDGKIGTKGPKSHPLFGSKRQDRRYDTVDELELGLYGWVAAKPGRRAEKDHAHLIAGSAEVNTRLDGILVGLYQAVLNLPDENRLAVLQELNENDVDLGDGPRARGTYQKYFEEKARKTGDRRIAPTITNGFLDVLAQPWRYSFRDKMIAIHDLEEYFGPAKKWVPPSAGEGLLDVLEPDEMLSTVGYRDGVRQTDPSRGRTRGPRRSQGTRNERDPVTRFARQLKLPIWAGSSSTAARMLKLGQASGAGIRDLTVLAHSIFAFWRVSYDHTSSLAPHSMHEVMDIAQNFGIPYDPRDPYRELRYNEVEERQQELKTDIDKIIDSFLAGIESFRPQLELPGTHTGPRGPATEIIDHAVEVFTEFRAHYPRMDPSDRPRAFRAVLQSFTTLAELGIQG